MAVAVRRHVSGAGDGGIGFRAVRQALALGVAADFDLGDGAVEHEGGPVEGAVHVHGGGVVLDGLDALVLDLRVAGHIPAPILDRGFGAVGDGDGVGPGAVWGVGVGADDADGVGGRGGGARGGVRWGGKAYESAGVAVVGAAGGC